MQINEIDKKLSEEFTEFNNGLNEIKLPKNYITVFKKAAMNVPPLVHKVNVATVVKIKNKKVKELTRIDVRIATNLILNCSPIHYAETEAAADAILTDLAEIVAQTNLENMQKEAELNKKKQSMIQLAGIDVNQRNPKIYQA